MRTRCVLYLRISQDRSGESMGVDRQRRECEDLARRRGWEVVGEYADNDVSAYSGRRRPAFEAMLSDAAAHSFDAIVAYHQSRLSRRRADFGRILDLAQERRMTVAFVASPDIDANTSAGRMIAGIIAEVNENESAQISERVTLQKRDAAERGRWGGGPRVFGYLPRMAGLVEDEADVVRDVAARLLAGESLRSLAAELNRRGVPTARGGRWRTTTLRAMLMSARLSGQREHTPGGGGPRRRRGRGDGAIVAQATWPAILEPGTTARLRALLGDPDRLTYRPGKRLLTGGLARCGRCGSALNSRTRPDGRSFAYACIRHVGDPSCGGLSIVGPDVDALVTQAALQRVLAAVRGPRPRGGATGVDRGAEAGSAAAQARLSELAVDYARGTIGRDEYVAARRAVDEVLAALGARTARAVRDPLSGLPRTAVGLLEAWEEMYVDRRRAVLSVVVSAVTIAPTRKRGLPWVDLARVSVSWR